MNAQIGEIFRECYRYGMASHSDEIRGIKKILYYAQAELQRLEKEIEKNIPVRPLGRGILRNLQGEKNVNSAP
jgi:hypothetical protein